jgi:hypothetical protein
MQTMWGGNPNKCPYYERRDDLYMDKSIPLDKVKQAREEIQKLRGCSCSCSDGIIDDVEDILDKLIESEGVNG